MLVCHHPPFHFLLQIPSMIHLDCQHQWGNKHLKNQEKNDSEYVSEGLFSLTRGGKPPWIHPPVPLDQEPMRLIEGNWDSLPAQVSSPSDSWPALCKSLSSTVCPPVHRWLFMQKVLLKNISRMFRKSVGLTLKLFIIIVVCVSMYVCACMCT